MSSHNPDANDEDTAFAGGSKELEPGDWDLTTEAGGVNPGKANIRDAWSAVDQPGGNTFLYLGFTREASTGTTFLTFELNHDAGSGTTARRSIPCRRTGDMLISYEQQGNDRRDVVIRRWTTTSHGHRQRLRHERAAQDLHGQLSANDDVAGGDERRRRSRAACRARSPARCRRVASARRRSTSTPLLEQAFGERVHGLQLGLDALAVVGRRSRRTCRTTWRRGRWPSGPARRRAPSSSTSNANGRRDPNEPGIPRFQIWADYNNDGMRDDNEPFSVSRQQRSLRDPRHSAAGRDLHGCARSSCGAGRAHSRSRATGNARTRTRPRAARDPRPAAASSAGGDRSTSTPTPNVEGRDFGNWFPARLTVEKRLFPATDPGRFDLLVNGERRRRRRRVIERSGRELRRARHLHGVRARGHRHGSGRLPHDGLVPRREAARRACGPGPFRPAELVWPARR